MARRPTANGWRTNPLRAGSNAGDGAGSGQQPPPAGAAGVVRRAETTRASRIRGPLAVACSCVRIRSQRESSPAGWAATQNRIAIASGRLASQRAHAMRSAANATSHNDQAFRRSRPPRSMMKYLPKFQTNAAKQHAQAAAAKAKVDDSTGRSRQPAAANAVVDATSRPRQASYASAAARRPHVVPARTTAQTMRSVGTLLPRFRSWLASRRSAVPGIRRRIRIRTRECRRGLRASDRRPRAPQMSPRHTRPAARHDRLRFVVAGRSADCGTPVGRHRQDRGRLLEDLRHVPADSGEQGDRGGSRVRSATCRVVAQSSRPVAGSRRQERRSDGRLRPGDSRRREMLAGTAQSRRARGPGGPVRAGVRRLPPNHRAESETSPRRTPIGRRCTCSPANSNRRRPTTSGRSSWIRTSPSPIAVADGRATCSAASTKRYDHLTRAIELAPRDAAALGQPGRFADRPGRIRGGRRRLRSVRSP